MTQSVSQSVGVSGAVGRAPAKDDQLGGQKRRIFIRLVVPDSLLGGLVDQTTNEQDVDV